MESKTTRKQLKAREKVMHSDSGEMYPDRVLKLQVLMDRLHVATLPELTKEVFKLDQKGELAYWAYDSLRKGSRPTKSVAPVYQFWDTVPTLIPMREGVSGTFLIDGSIDEFIACFGDESDRVNARAVVDRLLEKHELGEETTLALQVPPAKARSGLTVSDHPSIWLEHRGEVENIKHGIKAGRIDQKHYYLDPESSSKWFGVVASDYPMYEYCRTGLESLFGCSKCKDLLARRQPTTAVMLTGGGAPSKDLLFMRRLLDQPYLDCALNYYLMDISLYMLRDSLMWLHEHAPNKLDFGKVSLNAVHGDVLQMTEADRAQFHHHGSVLFAITGGTIGNLSEKKFFRSLNRASSPGDLLILSADTVDGLPNGDVELLAAPYQIPEFRKWLSPVLAKVLHEAKWNVALDDALDQVRIAPVIPDRAEEGSDVDGTYSVAATLKIPGLREPLTIFTSARYQAAMLSDFAGRYGWNLVQVVPSPAHNGEHFKQFLFERKEPE